MTNLDYLRTLSAEELAEWFYGKWLDHIQYRWSSSQGGLVIWLKEEQAEQTEPSTDCPQSNICKKPCKECGACEEECGMWKALNNPSTDCGWK